MAAVAPMPSVRTTRDTAVKAGDRRSARAANLKSDSMDIRRLVRAQRLVVTGMIARMSVQTEPRTRNRAEISDAHKWRLDDIYPDWATWETAYAELERRIGEYAALKGTLEQGATRLLAAYE